jgi:hypothetical protein
MLSVIDLVMALEWIEHVRIPLLVVMSCTLGGRLRYKASLIVRWLRLVKK